MQTSHNQRFSEELFRRWSAYAASPRSQLDSIEFFMLRRFTIQPSGPGQAGGEVLKLQEYAGDFASKAEPPSYFRFKLFRPMYVLLE